MLPHKFTPNFKSAFKSELHAFLSHKRACGLKYDTHAHILDRFDKYLQRERITDFSQNEIKEWLERGEHEGAGPHYVRISLYRQLVFYLNRHGNTISLPLAKSSLNKSFVPYIFTKEQIMSVLQTADQLSKVCNSNQHLVMPVMLRLLYCCGLRISEAASLRIKDIDLTRRTVSILHGKNDISRTLPMSESLCNTISGYLEEMYIATRPDDFVFPTPKMERYSKNAIYQAFRNILWTSGIAHGGRGKGPRLHDLRHTFSVHSLQKLIYEGRDTYLLMPILSRYLGHKNIYETEKYLRLTAEMYPDILEKVRQAYDSPIPEVAYETN
ncbi:MAG: Tyrosine recombinase XerD [Firmicutes bacterium ADurb.Bin356]|nr:MAG: Tyrosine recombinase XerD [Firmicutes bacterium ADurb.Bin356]